jgi:hypothetical protein
MDASIFFGCCFVFSFAEFLRLAIYTEPMAYLWMMIKLFAGNIRMNGFGSSDAKHFV